MITYLNDALRQEMLSIYNQLLNQGALHPEERLKEYYSTFRQKFGPEALSSMDGEELLEIIHAHGNKNSLVYWLEFKDDEEFPDIFGGIGGGSALKFRIYRSKETEKWMTGSPQNQKVISVAEAVRIARIHRDQFVKGCEAINLLPNLPDAGHYEELQKKMEEIAPDVSNTAWGHKYFSLLFPEKLDDYHNLDYQQFQMIKSLVTPPKFKGRYSYARPFVAMKTELEIPMNHLTSILNHRNGRPVRYWRIGTRIKDVPRWNEMRSGNFSAVGWAKLGDLSALSHDQKSKDKLKEMIKQHFNYIPTQVGKQSAQLFNFVTAIQENDILLVSDGSEVLGIGKVEGDYYHEPGSDFAHRRPVKWIDLSPWKMPIPEGLQTTVHEVRKHPENLIETEKHMLAPKSIPSVTPGIFPLSGMIGKIQKILERKRQVILYGPPGTGKTYWAQKAAQELAAINNFKKPLKDLTPDELNAINNYSSSNIGYVNLCCFHPEYGYEHFIEGYRPDLINDQLCFKLRDGIFKELCDKALKALDKRFYLIIDEINRGDIPRIFGELLMIIEANKRGNQLRLPVSGRYFQVPDNVYIIGTMNTADRSIALLDTALRRRFGFVELMPDVSVLEDQVLEGLPVRLWLKALNERICQYIGRDARNLQIGHSYFMPEGKTVDSFRKFADIIREDVIPLLEEYCYEDYSILVKLLGTSLVDESAMRIRDELFDLSSKEKLLSALIAPCPEIAASSLAVDSEADETQSDDSENEDTGKDEEAQ